MDENLRGVLVDAVRRHGLRVGTPVNITEVGEPPDLPIGSDDRTSSVGPSARVGF